MGGGNEGWDFSLLAFDKTYLLSKVIKLKKFLIRSLKWIVYF